MQGQKLTNAANGISLQQVFNFGMYYNFYKSKKNIKRKSRQFLEI